MLIELSLAILLVACAHGSVRCFWLRCRFRPRRWMDPCSSDRVRSLHWTATGESTGRLRCHQVPLLSENVSHSSWCTGHDSQLKSVPGINISTTKNERCWRQKPQTQMPPLSRRCNKGWKHLVARKASLGSITTTLRMSGSSSCRITHHLSRCRMTMGFSNNNLPRYRALAWTGWYGRAN